MSLTSTVAGDGTAEGAVYVIELGIEPLAASTTTVPTVESPPGLPFTAGVIVIAR